MNATDLIPTLEEGLREIPLLDIHTHLDAAHLTARGLHDVLLYHMIVSDLSSAGCPCRARLSEDPDEDEAQARLIEAIPYVPFVRNTSGYWGVRIILRDLYGWREPITSDNWRRLHAMIRERAGDGDVGDARSCGGRECGAPAPSCGAAATVRPMTSSNTRWNGPSSRAPQWGVNDIPLYELERAWNQPGPGAPLPVTLGDGRPKLEHTLRTVADVHAAIAHYVRCIPYDQVLSTAQHISTDVNLRPVTEAQMAAALARRDHATPDDRDVYASYILEVFLTALEPHADRIVYQFSIGAEPLPYETGSKLRQDTIFEVAALAARHPRLRFQVFLASEHANQSFCTLVRELPNISLAGFWWHNLFPGIIRKVMADRLDMVAANRQVGFFSDAYCLEWTYAKAAIIRRQLAEVLAQKIGQGQYDVDEALAIARQILYESPQSLNGMRPA